MFETSKHYKNRSDFEIKYYQKTYMLELKNDIKMIQEICNVFVKGRQGINDGSFLLESKVL